LSPSCPSLPMMVIKIIYFGAQFPSFRGNKTFFCCQKGIILIRIIFCIKNGLLKISNRSTNKFVMYYICFKNLKQKITRIWKITIQKCFFCVIFGS
jgi:hypothetical protein